MELVREQPREINRLFSVSKDGGEKQRLILDVRRANCYFIEPEESQIHYRGLFMHLEKAEKEKLFVGTLEIDNFYHRLRLPEHLRPFLG